MVAKKEPKKKRNKPGYRETDRLCKLCDKIIPQDKSLYRHHISYGNTTEGKKRNAPHPPRRNDICRSLHYVCHGAAHCRIEYHNPYEKKYGKDFAAVALALDLFKLCKPILREAIAYINFINKKEAPEYMKKIDNGG